MVFFFFIIFLLSFGKILTGTNKLWIGKSGNSPIEILTELNIGDYAEEKFRPLEISYTNKTYNIYYDNTLNHDRVFNNKYTRRYYHIAILEQPSVTCPQKLTDNSRISVSISGNISVKLNYPKDTKYEYSEWDSGYLDICTRTCSNTVNSWTSGSSLIYPTIRTDLDENDREASYTSDNLKSIINYEYTDIPSDNVDWNINKSFTISKSYTLLSSDNILSGILLSAVAVRHSDYRNIAYCGIKGTVTINNLKFKYDKI